MKPLTLIFIAAVILATTPANAQSWQYERIVDIFDGEKRRAWIRGDTWWFIVRKRGGKVEALWSPGDSFICPTSNSRFRGVPITWRFDQGQTHRGEGIISDIRSTIFVADERGKVSRGFINQLMTSTTLYLRHRDGCGTEITLTISLRGSEAAIQQVLR